MSASLFQMINRYLCKVTVTESSDAKLFNVMLAEKKAPPA